MQYKVITKENFTKFVDALIKKKEVVGPKKKKVRFVYDKLTDSKELRLDFDTTILPPKKYFFPTNQDLLTFDSEKYEECIDPKDLVILGVHPYDIKAISQLDILFRDGRPDYNYLANREAATIIGCNVQNIYKTAFFGSIGSGDVKDGFDMFLTDLSDKYLVEVATPKGEELLKLGTFADADKKDINAKSKIIKETNEKCKEKFDYSTKDIAEKTRNTFKHALWKDLSEKCFSCGSCNLVCPTCYCFDVQDMWNIDQKSGKRFRSWDGCLLPEFATVTVQGGTENFREQRAERYRHRVMRKLTYLNSKLGAPACVGCGRCSSACTADIANPVNIINTIMEAK